MTPAWRGPERSVDLQATNAGVREHGAIDFHIMVVSLSGDMSV
ncbi:MAG: hypothetical protein Q4E24_02750 [bacterium]|nr:hypothetical protein [bacterium]